MGQRTVLVTAHTGRENALRSARFVAERLAAAGIAVRTLAGEFASPGAHEVPAGAGAAEGAELVIVLGGDGSLLRAAELSRPAGVPLIGVNLGHVGFLAEAEPDGLADLVERVVARDYAVELIVASETSGAVLWCDGRRKVDLPPGARMEVRRGTLPVLLARLQAPDSRGGGFTDRLVAKFGLPVAGWRGRTWEDAGEHA